MKTYSALAAFLAALTTLASAQSSNCPAIQAVALEALITCLETGSESDAACNAAYEEALSTASNCNFDGDTFLAPSASTTSSSNAATTAATMLTLHAPPYPTPSNATATKGGNATMASTTGPVVYTTMPCVGFNATMCGSATMTWSPTAASSTYAGAAARWSAAVGAVVVGGGGLALAVMQ